MFEEVSIAYPNKILKGFLIHPDGFIKGWIIFVHGSGSSRKSTRNNWIANKLVQQGFGALLFDLLTPQEDENYLNRFNIKLLSSRLHDTISWLMKSQYYRGEKIGLFGASTGAAAALKVCSEIYQNNPIYAVVSRGGRPDLLEAQALKKVGIPVLLIVGEFDEEVIRLNEMVQTKLRNSKLKIVPRATHLFEESGALERVLELTADWFITHLGEPEKSVDFFI